MDSRVASVFAPSGFAAPASSGFPESCICGWVDDDSRFSSNFASSAKLRMNLRIQSGFAHFRPTLDAFSQSHSGSTCRQAEVAIASAHGRVRQRPQRAVVLWLSHRGGRNRSPCVYRCLSPQEALTVSPSRGKRSESWFRFGFGGIKPGTKSTGCRFRIGPKSFRSMNPAKLSRWHRLVTSWVGRGSAPGSAHKAGG
jgi:hypothetical protein